MSIIPASEYRDLFYVWFMGPFDADDFVQYNISSDSFASSSISSISDSSSLSLPATSGAISSMNFGPTAEGGAGGFCPDKDTYVDAAWLRAETISTVDVAKFRLLAVANGQRIMAAVQNNQFVTDQINVGDESSSESVTSWNQDTGKFEPAVNRTKLNLKVAHDRGQNVIKAGGILLPTFDLAPTNVTGLRIGIRLRERRL